MESKMFKIYARNDERIQLKVFPGHFATPPVAYYALSGYHHHEVPLFRSEKNRPGTFPQLRSKYSH